MGYSKSNLKSIKEQPTEVNKSSEEPPRKSPKPTLNEVILLTIH